MNTQLIFFCLNGYVLTVPAQKEFSFLCLLCIQICDNSDKQ